jgi:hypothetical protein
MSRVGGDIVTVKPSNNIYTVLSGVALIVVILGLIVIWVRAEGAFGGLLSAPQRTTATR